MSAIFSKMTINGIDFKNRILRSSIGGRMSTYDGTVTDVWKNFEKRFADGGVAGIISTTFHVNKARLSPPQYPSIADDKYVPYLAKHIAGIKKDARDCRYIVQIGDPGYTTYTSLFPEAADGQSSSPGFDFGYGYTNRRSAMTTADIDKSINDFSDAAARCQAAGADGIEVTATKGYLVHQFLNPLINHRDDEWGGNADNRFRFLERIVTAIRQRVGTKYLFGIRLSSADLNHSPLPLALLRLPWPPLKRARWIGNDEAQMIDYGKRLAALGVDYLHVVAGYGFPNPRDVPGPFPFDGIKIFFNSNRHLSGKARVRATLFNLVPSLVLRPLLNWGWKYEQGINLPGAIAFKKALPAMPVIANGGFQERSFIEGALQDIDMVSMARALIANPDLVQIFASGKNCPDNPCTHCNLCVGRTVSSPLGCYDVARFNGSLPAMQAQILDWNRPDPAV